MNKILNLFIGIILSLGGLVYAFWNLDIYQVWFHLQSINLGFIVIVFTLFIYSVHVRAKRWQILIRPLEEIPTYPLFSATIIGYFGNSVLPFRLGEILRAFSLSKDSKLKVSSIMGTIVLDRILDIAGLFLFSLVLMLIYPMEKSLKTGILIMALFLLGISVFIFVIAKNNQKWNSNKNLFGGQFNPKIKKIWDIIQNVINGSIQIVHSKHKGIIIFYTLFLWVIYLACMHIVVLAVGVNLSWQQTGLLLLATTLSISVPAAPGYVGTHHAVVIYMMVSVFSIDQGISQSLAIILHAVGFLPFVIVGAWFFAKSSVRFVDVKNA